MDIWTSVYRAQSRCDYSIHTFNDLPSLTTTDAFVITVNKKERKQNNVLVRGQYFKQLFQSTNKPVGLHENPGLPE